MALLHRAATARDNKICIVLSSSRVSVEDSGKNEFSSADFNSYMVDFFLLFLIQNMVGSSKGSLLVNC